MIEQVNLVHDHQFLPSPTKIINMRTHKERDLVFLGFVDDLRVADVPCHSIMKLLETCMGT